MNAKLVKPVRIQTASVEFYDSEAATPPPPPPPDSANNPLTLYYTQTGTVEGLEHYAFELINDNHNGAWFPGQNFNWIVFGDTRSGDSPLQDFRLSDDAPAPFQGLAFTSGGHNGPTLLDFNARSISEGGWVPNFVGDVLTWQGDSTAVLGAGQLLWSDLEAKVTNRDEIFTGILVDKLPQCAGGASDAPGSKRPRPLGLGRVLLCAAPL